MEAVASGPAHLRRQVVRVGLRASVLACLAVGLYLTLTPDGPSRPLLWATTGASLAITGGLSAAHRLRLMPRSSAMTVLHAWSASQTTLIAVSVALDGGPSSPYNALLFLPLVACSVGFRPRAVAAHGLLASVLLLASWSAATGTVPRSAVVWVAAIGLTASVGSSTARRLLALSAQLDRANRELAHAATIDALTRCLNHGAFHAQLATELAQRRRSGGALTLLALDVDHFKRVNDAHGHPVGDEVLACVAEAIRGHVRDADVVGRTGGEEFAVVLPDTDVDDARLVGERVRAAVAACAAPVPVTVSVGLAEAPRVDLGPDELMRRADAALYAAKRAGRDRVVAAPMPS